MTKVEFFSQEGRIEGFCCSGHSGYAEEGADVVCAVVTTAVQFAAAVIVDTLGERASVKVDAQNAQITLRLPAACDEEDTVQAVLTGMMLTLLKAREEYPDYIEVMEV
jgi:uncharacterized protein YsxB (DUF464 family)